MKWLLFCTLKECSLNVKEMNAYRKGHFVFFNHFWGTVNLADSIKSILGFFQPLSNILIFFSICLVISSIFSPPCDQFLIKTMIIVIIRKRGMNSF